MKLSELYRLAISNGIPIMSFKMEASENISLSMRMDKKYAIAMDYDKIKTKAEETVILAHELGHCQTASFYNIHNPLDIRQKHENKATNWAIKKLISKDELETAVKKYGLHEVWELAEYFNVTEDLIQKAVEYYKKNPPFTHKI